MSFWRIVRFGIVGLVCYCLQLLLFTMLTSYLQCHVFAAGLLSFATSAQCNFVLSRYITWHDRHETNHILFQWLKFSVVAVTSSVLNASVLWCIDAMFPALQNWIALLVANTINSCGTFAANHLIVFNQKRSSNAHVAFTRIFSSRS